MQRQRLGKWSQFVRIVKLSIFLTAATLFINSNLELPKIPCAPTSIQNVVNTVTSEREANAAAISKKEKETLMQMYKERATGWLYKKTHVVSRVLVNDYIDFITANVEPTLQPLVLALLTVESEGNPCALSPKGACGATQIVFKYWGKELIEQGLIAEERDLFDYKMNILCHQYIIKKIMAENNGNLRKSLVDYSGYKVAYADKVISRINDLNRSLSTGAETKQENTQGKLKKKKHTAQGKGKKNHLAKSKNGKHTQYAANNGKK